MRITTLVVAAALAIVSALPAGAEEALETENVGTFFYLSGVAATPMDAEELAGTYGAFTIHVFSQGGFDHQHMRPPITNFPPTGTGDVTVGCGGPPLVGIGC